MPQYFNIEDLAEVAKWFVIMLTESAPQCGFESCCDHHSNHAWNGMELLSEKTGILIADRLALLHVFLRSIMLHSNKGTSRIYAH